LLLIADEVIEKLVRARHLAVFAHAAFYGSHFCVLFFLTLF